MNAEIVESVHHAIVPGDMMDSYYPGKENTELQSFGAVLDNKFQQDLPSLAFGSSSTLLFNPAQGLGDIILTATLPAPTNLPAGAGSYQNFALPRGWLYALIDTVAIRIAGSSLYYFTGDQLLVDILEDCEDDQKKEAVFQLGGAECLTPADFLVDQNRTAYAYIKCPWNTISALQKQLPLPTDLLTQPVQIIVTFKRIDSVAFGLAGASVSALPTAFQNATVGYRQVTLTDSGHLLARRMDMNSHALTYPLRYFAQTTYRTQQQCTAGQIAQVNLTGFRAGSLKYINIWARKVRDGLGAAVPAGAPWNWAPMGDITLTVNGLQYYVTRKNSAQMWALCDRKTPAAVFNTVLSDAGGGNANATPSITAWQVVPFSQVEQPAAYENEVNTGLAIQNSVVNLSFSVPEDGVWEINAAYHYTCEGLLTKGTFEYVF